ncbi:MAG: hypothetical protein ACRDXD_09255, partial [Acidimicrobiia bacterium]
MTRPLNSHADPYRPCSRVYENPQNRCTESTRTGVRKRPESASKKLLAEAQASSLVAEGVSANARAKAIARLEELVGMSERVVDQVRA